MTSGMVKYKRVAQRLREKHREEAFPIKELENAIFMECGTDPRTVKAAIDRMERLELITKEKPPAEFGVAPVVKWKLSHRKDEYF